MFPAFPSICLRQGFDIQHISCFAANVRCRVSVADGELEFAILLDQGDPFPFLHVAVGLPEMCLHPVFAEFDIEFCAESDTVFGEFRLGDVRVDVRIFLADADDFHWKPVGSRRAAWQEDGEEDCG